MFLHDDKWHDPNVAEWMYHLMNDPEYYEQFRYKDVIDDYNMIIMECQQVYDNPPVTSRLTCAKCLSAIKRAQKELAATLEQYDRFKQYKARTAITE